jgi:hypothetical protein
MNLFIKYLIFLVLSLILLMVACAQQNQFTSDFAAYYTKYSESDDITGEYADVVVRFSDNKKFVFSRETSYLPFLEYDGEKWYMEDIIGRKGDGEEKRPDKYNLYSYVRIINSTPDEAIIHWRYVPDFKNPGFKGVVHEIYSIKSDGKISRMIRPARAKLDEYADPQNIYVEELELNQSGIERLSLKEPVPSNENIAPIEGSPVISKSIARPVLWWTFDDGLNERSFNQKDLTMEMIQNIPCPINGNLSLFKKGVSGTAMAFDGYYSQIKLANAEPPEKPSSFTLEAWIALGAYPWMEGAVLDITEKDGGIYFGISDLGQLIFKIVGKNKEHVLVSKKEISLYKWSYIAAIYNIEQNEAVIFIDGKNAGKLSLGDDQLNLKTTDISIGLNKQAKRTTEHVSRDYPPDVRTPEGNQPMIYGIEGLIDEVKISFGALSSAQISDSYKMIWKNHSHFDRVDLEPRILPGDVDGRNADQFGAYYTNLKYHDLWDNLWRSSDWPDIVVRFDELPCNVVYWRGPNYGPGWVTEKNIWMCDQSSEIYHYYGCMEHMADKQNRFSHVRLIENSDARVVVHWRYASADIMYEFENHRTWSDEYHYIYPDGSAIRYVNYYDEETGWQDVQFFAQPGSTPEDQINLQALTVANLAGDTYKMDWSKGIPENKLEDASVSVVNFKSEFKVFVIYPDGSEIGAWGERERATPETHFAGPWNHWPVSQMPNDGRYAMRTDRVTHSALGGAGPEKFAIFGFTNQDVTALLPMARFWNYAPAIKITAGANDVKYEQYQKAYLLNATGKKISMTVQASEKSPLTNPCFVISGVKKGQVGLTVDNRLVMRGKEFRYGFVPAAEGYNLIVWLNLQSEKPVDVNFTY